MSGGAAGRQFKAVYISHPLRGGTDRENPDISAVVRNKESVDRICRDIAHKFPHILPLSPVNAFSFLAAFKEDRLALGLDMRLLEFADELWVYGDCWASEGCMMEIKRARELGLPIFYESGHSEVPGACGG
jgi:hypothetical protein